MNDNGKIATFRDSGSIFAVPRCMGGSEVGQFGQPVNMHFDGIRSSSKWQCWDVIHSDFRPQAGWDGEWMQKSKQFVRWQVSHEWTKCLMNLRRPGQK